MSSRRHASLPEVYTASDQTVQHANDNPAEIDAQARRERLRTHARNGKVVSRFVDMRILSTAMELADNDSSRLVINEDNSISVVNNPK